MVSCLDAIDERIDKLAKMKDEEVTGSTAPVSELCFCSSTSGLAVGNQFGLVRVYNFSSSRKRRVFTLSRHRTMMNLFDKDHVVDKDAFVAPGASVIGDVQVGRGLFGDVNSISVGSGTN
ncbi:hypothetical protein Tco_0788884 [Tanacetum coccineum]